MCLLFLSEKQHASDLLQSEASEILLKICPMANHTSHDHTPGLSEIIEDVKKHACYNVSHDSHVGADHSGGHSHYIQNHGDIPNYGDAASAVIGQLRNAVHHISKRAAGSGGGDHGHVDHTLNENLTHAFHLGSLVILSILVFEVNCIHVFVSPHMVMLNNYICFKIQVGAL